MEYKLKNDLLKVKLQSFGGALSSIRDRDGGNIYGKEIRHIGAARLPCFFQSAEAAEITKQEP